MTGGVELDGGKRSKPWITFRAMVVEEIRWYVIVADRGVLAGTVEGIVISMIRPYGCYDISPGQLRDIAQNARDIVRKVTALGCLDLRT